MTSDKLRHLLGRLREDAALLLESEQATKQGIILPILGHLGWDRDDIREVIPEYSVGTGRVDYCLRLGHKNCVFIEAKRTNQELERHQEQLLDYAFREGVELAALTNGLLWWLYLPLLGGSWEQRKFFTIDITQQAPEAAAGHFEAYLSRVGVGSGEAVARARKVHQSREKERLTSLTIPRAWRALCEGPDELLVELFTEKVESLCGHQPTPDQVAQFLERQMRGSRLITEPAPRAPKPLAETKRPIKRRPTGTYTFAKPRSYTLFGRSRSVSTYKEILLAVCEDVAKREGQRFDRVLQLKGRKRNYFSRDARGMTSPYEIDGTGMYVETNLSANDIVRRCHQVLRLFGHAADTLIVETS